MKFCHNFLVFFLVLFELKCGYTESDSLFSPYNLNAAIAKFQVANSGVKGFISVKGGVVSVNLDFSKFNTSLLPNPSCWNNGITYHIHQKWNYTDQNDRAGAAACAFAYTGGHYDPWKACSKLSGNPFCNIDSPSDYGCISIGGSQGTYNCSSYPENIFSCEVGDWSGKYGNLYLTHNRVYQRSKSFWEVDAEDVMDLSVVLHCSTEETPRFLCAPFVLSNNNDNDNNMDDNENVIYNRQNEQEDTMLDAVYANFDDYGWIKFSKNGEVMMNFYDPIDEGNQCNDDQYNIYIYTSWNNSYNDDDYLVSFCDYDTVGEIWDPTISCIPGSEFDNIYCDGNGHLCNQDSDVYNYECNYNIDPYSCAISDLSGKLDSISLMYNDTDTDTETDTDNDDDNDMYADIDMDEQESQPNQEMNNNENNYYYYKFKDELLPPLNDLLGRSIVFSCGDNKNITLLCGVITDNKPSFDDDLDEMGYGDDSMSSSSSSSSSE